MIFADFARQNCGLIETPGEKPLAVKRDRDQQIGGFQKFRPCARHPAPHRPGDFDPVAIFELVNQLRSGTLFISRHRPRSPVGGRIGNCRRRQNSRAKIVREGRPEPLAIRTLDESNTRPASHAEIAGLRDRRPTGHATRRIEQIEQASARRRQSADDSAGPLAQGFIKIVPSDSFSVQAGQLPTLIGAEYTFTFENANIQRGLLWNQENAISRGFQANYSIGPVALSAAWTDGFYSGQLDWVTGLATWTIDKEDTLTFVGGANAKSGGAQVTNQSFVANYGGGSTANAGNGVATPLLQNNEQIYNLIYTRASGPWTVTPYLQYTYVPAMANLGYTKSASTMGGAVIVNYTFDKCMSIGGFNLEGYSLPARVEYISSSGGNGHGFNGASNLLYGLGSDAYSITITPTYQKGIFFARGELAYVGVVDGTSGAMFGKNGARNGQTRGLLEVGFLF